MTRYMFGRRGRTMTDEQIVQAYLSGISSMDVGLEAGCTAETVRDLVIKAGHKMRPRGGQKPKRPRPIPDEEIIARYKNGESGSRLADLCRCSTAMIYLLLKRAGVVRRKSWEHNAAKRRSQRQAES